jgi:hypothetical protein
MTYLCDYYIIEGMSEIPIHFIETEDSINCCCKFRRGDNLTSEQIRSFAYLGAMMVLIHHGESSCGLLPYCLPNYMREEIDAYFIQKCC